MTSRRAFLFAAGMTIGAAAGTPAGMAIGGSSEGNSIWSEQSNRASTEQPAKPPNGIADSLVTMTRDRRQEVFAGVVPELVLEPVASDMAGYQARHMADTSEITSKGPEGEELRERVSKYGFSAKAAELRSSTNVKGELDEIANRLIEPWKSDNSSDLYGREWRRHGVAVAASSGTVFACQVLLGPPPGNQ